MVYRRDMIETRKNKMTVTKWDEFTLLPLGDTCNGFGYMIEYRAKVLMICDGEKNYERSSQDEL